VGCPQQAAPVEIHLAYYIKQGITHAMSATPMEPGWCAVHSTPTWLPGWSGMHCTLSFPGGDWELTLPLPLAHLLLIFFNHYTTGPWIPTIFYTFLLYHFFVEIRLLSGNQRPWPILFDTLPPSQQYYYLPHSAIGHNMPGPENCFWNNNIIPQLCTWMPSVVQQAAIASATNQTADKHN